jgi:hypothetical protein
MAAWVTDLKTIGYEFPELKKHSSNHAGGAPQSHSLAVSRAQPVTLSTGGEPATGVLPFVAPRTPLHWKRYSKCAAFLPRVCDICTAP